VSLLKFVFDWLVLMPAAFFAYLVACLVGLTPFVGAPMAWHYTIKYLEPGNDDYPGRPRELSTWIMAGIAGLYAFLVLGFAVYRLPSLMFAIMRATD
jgi:hypothetical protein